MIVPDISHQPQVHNPFPQLSRVAVAPFFNQSDEATVDGRRFAMAYFGELQATAGFEIVPLGVVEEAILRNGIDLSKPAEVRRLAKVLGVDAVVIGTVTDYSPYYPPRCGMRVEWYTANSGFHEIPPGYGLPWGTPEEEFIPPPLVYEAEMALARAQLATQTPDCTSCCETPNVPITPDLPVLAPNHPSAGNGASEPNAVPLDVPAEPLPPPTSDDEESAHGNATTAYEEVIARAKVAGSAVSTTGERPCAPGISQTTGPIDMGGAIPPNGTLPPDWPDERGFIPPAPSPVRPPCVVNSGPVMTHTRIYHGNDPQFTEALAGYVHFRDEQRFGGWQTYLQRSEDFIRFCCHLHISEMLSARGGAGETRVVCEWPASR
jgi:hypothetical protein